MYFKPFLKLLIILLLATIGTYSLEASVYVPDAKPNTGTEQLTVQEFLQTRIRDMDDLFDEDLNWKQKLVIRLVKKKLRKVVKKQPELAARKWSDLGQVQYLTQHTQSVNGPEATNKKTDGFALASFILGLISAVSLITVTVSIVSGLLAVVCGIVGLINIGKNKATYKGRGFAIGGIILGTAVLALFTVLILTFGA